MHTYDLFNRHEYFDHVITQCNKAQAGDTIVLATLEFRPDQPKINSIVEALCTAAKQGAHVTFLVDAYSFMLKEGSMLGPVFFRKKDPKQGYGQFKKVVKAVHTLREHGVICEVINKPRRPLKNPFSGRSHIKFAVINDEVLIGGCNLSHPDQLDVMVRTVNSRLSQYLVALAADIAAAKIVREALGKKDFHFKIDDETELLIDAGVRRQSVIYDRALALIKNAKHTVYMTCQYFPNASTPTQLAQAHERGVDIHLVYNHPDQHNGALRGVQKHTIALKKKRLPASVFADQLDMDRNYLHAKILLNEHEVIIGSHNFVEMGVSLGTAEIALRSTSPEFIATAKQWITQL